MPAQIFLFCCFRLLQNVKEEYHIDLECDLSLDRVVVSRACDNEIRPLL